MNTLFNSSNRYVVIYSSDTDVSPDNWPAHVRNRKFSSWIASNKPEWKLLKHIPNKYPVNGGANAESIADFYIYCKD